MLEQHPHHVRRSIALVVTGAIALALLSIFFVRYLGPQKNTKTNESGTKLKDLYTTITEKTQSFFEPDRAIIESQ